MDALDFVHAVATQFPGLRRHFVRDDGACSHRRRAAVHEKNRLAEEPATAAEAIAVALEPLLPADPGSAEARRRSARARLLEKVFEVDPLRFAR